MIDVYSSALALRPFLNLSGAYYSQNERKRGRAHEVGIQTLISCFLNQMVILTWTGDKIGVESPQEVVTCSRVRLTYGFTACWRIS